MKWTKRQRNGAIIVVVVVLVAAASAGAYFLLGDDRKPEPKPVAKETPVESAPKPIYWPLTGIEAPSAEAITKRPLSVKIENSHPARPQLGLQQADVVYETMVEGGITRFNAIYQSQLPKEVGPVRSARLSDAYIVPEYNALFTFSGAHKTVKTVIKSAGLDNLSPDVAGNGPYRRSPERSAPHNLYMDIQKIYAAAPAHSYEVTATVTPLAFDHSAAESSATPTIGKVTVPLTQSNVVTWTWDAPTHAFARANDGESFSDAATKKTVTATNVVVMWAKYTPATINKGAQTWDIAMIGSGPVSIFTKGQRFDGTWTATKDAPPTFADASGKALLLTPGNTWFEVAPADVKITTE